MTPKPPRSNTHSKTQLEIPRIKLPDLDYADDIALFETNEKTTFQQKPLESLQASWASMMSFKKTVGPSSSPKPSVQFGNEGNIKVVDHFGCVL